MGCGAAKATQTSDGPQNITNEKNKILDSVAQEDHKSVSDRPPTPVPKPVAFEIPIDPVVADGADDDSIVKKHPPKRLARLEEQRASIPTVDDIKEKQAEAEKRRQEIIEEKINKARAVQAKMQGEKTSQKSTSSDETTRSNNNNNTANNEETKNKLNGESNEPSKEKESAEITTTTGDKNSIDTRTVDKSENNEKDEKDETKSNESKTDGKSGDKVSAQTTNKTESTLS